jgi:hypothetical protein
VLLKRTKKAPADAKGKNKGAAVHYVTSLAPAGNVAGLTDKPELAKDFSKEEIEKFMAFQLKKNDPNAGEYDLEEADAAKAK